MRPHWGCSDSRTLVMQYCSGAAKDESAVCAPELFPLPLKHTLASTKQPPATCTEPHPKAPEHVDAHRQEPRDRSPIDITIDTHQVLELLNAMFPGAFVADARVGYKHEAIGLEATSAADKDDFHTFVFSEQARGRT